MSCATASASGMRCLGIKATPAPARARAAAVVARAGATEGPELSASRREALASFSLAPLAAALAAQGSFPGVAAAVDAGWELYQGKDLPASSYGGYGGNANESPVYSFEYPADWKIQVPGKIDKGTKGIDARVVSPSKGERIIVVTFGRAGESIGYNLGDIDSTFSGLAGADSDLQDALNDADDIIKGEREAGGRKFLDVEIVAPSVRFVTSITTSRGKVYAILARCPNDKSWKQEEPRLRKAVESFTILDDTRAKGYA